MDDVRSFSRVLQYFITLALSLFQFNNHGAGTVSTVKALVHPRFAGRIQVLSVPD